MDEADTANVLNDVSTEADEGGRALVEPNAKGEHDDRDRRATRER